MNTGLLIRNIGRWLLLVVMQVMVLDNVYLGGVINPILYILFILMLPTGMNKNVLLLIAFGTGLVVDVFNNMLGFHAFTCTLLAFLRILFADRILTKDDPVVIDTPSLYSVGSQPYIAWLAMMIGIYNFVYFTLVIFDIHDLFRILLLTVLSTILDMLLCLLYQSIFIRKNEHSQTSKKL